MTIRRTAGKAWIVSAVLLGLGLLWTASRMRGLDRRLDDSTRETARARTAIRELRERSRRSERHGEERVEGRISLAAAALQDRLDSFHRELRHSGDLHRYTLDEIERLRGTFDRDPELVAKRILRPSVQVAARGGVGGGTIISSRESFPGKFVTFVITAHHVIEKNVAGQAPAPSLERVQVRVYNLAGGIEETLDATIVAHDARKDLALLRLHSDRRFPNVARLAGRRTLRSLRVFTPIYAVGCPLGHDPLPSLGEISTLHKIVDGERFWMMNAPTFFGNSGGGIFHRETGELVGVSAMICTYDGFVSVPVPHLGIMVPLDVVCDWLEKRRLPFAYGPKSKPEIRRLEASFPRPFRLVLEPER